jgi:F0F1-type ATP synthase gamma subunit
VREITGVIIKGFEEARYDEVDLLYTRYHSIVNTKPMTLKLLPLERSEVLKTGGAMMGEPLFEPSRRDHGPIAPQVSRGSDLQRPG